MLLVPWGLITSRTPRILCTCALCLGSFSGCDTHSAHTQGHQCQGVHPLWKQPMLMTEIPHLPHPFWTGYLWDPPVSNTGYWCSTLGRVESHLIGLITLYQLPSFPFLTPPFSHPVSWDLQLPSSFYMNLYHRSTSISIQTRRILLGTWHLEKLDLPDYLVSGMAQALHSIQNGIALGLKGVFGAKIRFHDQPKFLETPLIILESEGEEGSFFWFPCIHLHLNLSWN